jgi:DNA ligase-1
MLYSSSARQAAHWALLFGSVCCFTPSMGAESEEAPTEVILFKAALSPPLLMLGKNWQKAADPADYLISEKLDGVRAHWDGQVLRFRSGRLINAPEWFTDALPDTPLDGELWIGRHRFDRTSGTVRRIMPDDAEWQQVKYMVFDLPGAAGTFVQRAQKINDLVLEEDVAWLQAVPQARGIDRAALHRQLLSWVGEGAEGLMLHRADALWAPGRSDDLRKLKLVPDEDARVVEVLPGKGRNAGRMGALLLEMPSGQRFALGTGFSDALRESPPAVGATVTYRYLDRTPAGIPKFASYLRSREAE